MNCYLGDLDLSIFTPPFGGKDQGLLLPFSFRFPDKFLADFSPKSLLIPSQSLVRL
jgi:hypothetical protein